MVHTWKFPYRDHTAFKKNICPRIRIDIVSQRVETISNIMISLLSFKTSKIVGRSNLDPQKKDRKAPNLGDLRVKNIFKTLTSSTSRYQLIEIKFKKSDFHFLGQCILPWHPSSKYTWEFIFRLTEQMKIYSTISRSMAVKSSKLSKKSG